MNKHYPEVPESKSLIMYDEMVKMGKEEMVLIIERSKSIRPEYAKIITMQLPKHPLSSK